VSRTGACRLESSEKGDTQILYDGHTVTVYDASNEHALPLHPAAAPGQSARRAAADGSRRVLKSTFGYCPEKSAKHEVPSVAKIEEAIAKLDHVNVSGAKPTSIAGRRVHGAGDAQGGGSLMARRRALMGRRQRPAAACRAVLLDELLAVIELAASEVSFGPVSLGVRIHCHRRTRRSKKSSSLARPRTTAPAPSGDATHPKVTSHGSGITAVQVLESQAKPGEKPPSLPKACRRSSSISDHRDRAADGARHAAQLRALRRPLRAGRGDHAGADRGSRAGPVGVAAATRRPFGPGLVKR